jgi:hypothetical protein
MRTLVWVLVVGLFGSGCGREGRKVGDGREGLLSQCSHQTINTVFSCRVYSKAGSFGEASDRGYQSKRFSGWFLCRGRLFVWRLLT